MRTRSDLGQVLDHNSTLVAHTKLKTRMESYRLARESFGMPKILKDCMLFELCQWKKKDEERRKEMKKIEIFKLGFSSLLEVSETCGVDKALE